MRKLFHALQNKFTDKLNVSLLITNTRISIQNNKRALEPMCLSRKLHVPCQRAFSLVEVVLALGIVSFAFIGIIGMLPVGMNTFRQATDATVQAQITQQIITQVRETNYADLNSFTKDDPATHQARIYLFDDQGILVSDESLSIYKVAVDVIGNTTVFPSSSGNADATPVDVAKLATVKIYIINTKDPGTDKEPDPKKNRNARIITTLAADSDI